MGQHSNNPPRNMLFSPTVVQRTPFGGLLFVPVFSACGTGFSLQSF